MGPNSRDMPFGNWTHTLRVVALLFHGLSFFLCSVLLAASRAPNVIERNLRARAKQRWGGLISGLVVALQHLTICSLGGLVTYLVLVLWGHEHRAAQLLPVLMPLQTLVGILFWSLALYDPWLL